MRKLFIIISILTLLVGMDQSPQIQPGLRGVDVPAGSNSGDFEVEFFPVAPYHVGDLVSARVTYTGSGTIAGKEIRLSILDQPEVILGSEKFNDYDQQAEFLWILDTSSFQPGFIRFTFEIPELNRAWQEGINLLPPKQGKHKTWTSITTDCCLVYYIKDSDAARDISKIEEISQETADKVLSQFFPEGIPEENPLEGEIQLVLVPAVLGHGGFATDTAVVTYTDWNWVGSSFENILHHEMVHVLDRKLNDEGPRPSLLSEGIAVYLSGGHYRDGDPLLRASALLALEEYIPLGILADDFYNFQHEAAYMEGAALVAYLVDLLGWEGFLDFYFNLEQQQSDSAILSTALEGELGMKLDEVEDLFLDYLNSLEPTEKTISDVRLTIEVYDMIRRYQSAVIPSANYQTAWWPSIDEALKMDVVGDYDKREKAPLNILIETRLINIQKAFEIQDYRYIEQQLGKIADDLEIIESSNHSASHYDLGWPLPHHPPILNTP